jgi:hypothetical protein
MLPTTGENGQGDGALRKEITWPKKSKLDMER